MKDLVCKFQPDEQQLLYQEWLVTNGLGGYACGSLGGAPMRKYNGLLVAALNAPFGRTVMLNYVADALILSDEREIPLSQLRLEDQKVQSESILKTFIFENNLPIWTYQIDDIILEKCLWMPHGQNTVYVRYSLLSAPQPIKIKWRPYLHFRGSEHSVNENAGEEYQVHAFERGYEISSPSFPNLILRNDQNPTFILDYHVLNQVYYEIEEKRGYEYLGSLSSPGYFLSKLEPHEKITFIASTESWNVMLAMSADEAWIAEKQRQKNLLKASKELAYSQVASKLVLAADQFIMTPISREKDIIRLKALGEDVRSIIAGYPWFTDWGRDTMISLEGLTLTTGRPQIAHSILLTFAYYIRDGLLPNMFPDGKNEGLYHTADATLWFFHAVDRYVTLTGDEVFLDFIIPKFQQIIDHHIKGTRFGIKMDEDGLLMQGQEGYQLTWMDAKVKDWVVTPRRGKAVEINALWYNALRLMELWTGKPLDIAKRCYDSFNERFWYAEGSYLYDVIDGESGNDHSLRPNQIFSISLRFPVLKNEYWKPVVDTVKRELLTIYGLRTLSPKHPDFKSYYDGDLWARDAAYHQGTVWPWLIGPFIDAWLKVYPQASGEAKGFLKFLEEHIDESCMGTIAEIFDAADPYHARGCFAQAWSVAEVLRAYAKLHVEDQPSLGKGSSTN